jgi:DNA-binding XRE family transcriptional regulator
MTRQQIKDLIDRRGFTVVSLAEEIGISRQSVHDIIAGRTRGASARYAFAAALRVPVADIWPEGSHQAA